MNNRQLEISRTRNELEGKRREIKQLATAEFDKEVFYPRLKELRAECEQIGHEYRFAAFGPTGTAWYYCIYCNQSRTED